MESREKGDEVVGNWRSNIVGGRVDGVGKYREYREYREYRMGRSR